MPRLAEEVRTLRAAGSYTRWLLQLAKVQVLVLDDWGLVGLDPLTREALMEILDDRRWPGHPGDQPVVGRALARLAWRPSAG